MVLRHTAERWLDRQRGLQLALVHSYGDAGTQVLSRAWPGMGPGDLFRLFTVLSQPTGRDGGDRLSAPGHAARPPPRPATPSRC
jgi:hypothetical protein